MEMKEILEQIEILQGELAVTDLLLDTVSDKAEYILYLDDKIQIAKRLLNLDELRLKLIEGSEEW